MRIHQEHANVFLTLYFPQLKSTLVGINYQMFLDVVVKCVIHYQNSKFAKREYVPGRHCKWNDVTLFTHYIDPMGVRKLQDNDSRMLLPEEERYSIKHPLIYFQDYKTAITEYDFF